MEDLESDEELEEGDLWFELPSNHASNAEDSILRYQCAVCDEKVPDKTALLLHLEHHSGTERQTGPLSNPAICSAGCRPLSVDKQYPCRVCSEGFTDRETLRAHMVSHAENIYQICVKQQIPQTTPTNNCDSSEQATQDVSSNAHVIEISNGESCSTVVQKSLKEDTGGCGQIESPVRAPAVNSKCDIETNAKKREKSFQCAACDKSFSDRRDLNRHWRTHSGEKPHVCPVCDKSFAQKNNLKRHYRIHSGEKPYKCSRCEKSFVNGSDLKKHTLTHTGEKPFPCTVCGKAFRQKGDMRKHFRTHYHQGLHYCFVCMASFQQGSELDEHMATHEKNEGDLNNSSDTNMDESMETSPTIARGNITDNALQTTYGDHEHDGEVGSDKDSITLSDSIETGQDRSDSESVKDSRIQIKEDTILEDKASNQPRVKSDKTLVDRHGSSLDTDVEHQQETSDNTELEGHGSKSPCTTSKQTSMGLSEETMDQLNTMAPLTDNQHECVVCRMVFSKTDVLHQHLQFHVDGGINTCPVCDRTFALNSDLKQHMLQHSYKKVFQCAMCQKTFNHHGNLKRHMLSHNDTKSFECVLCGKGFTRSNNLKKHMNKNHLGRRHAMQYPSAGEQHEDGMGNSRA